MTSVQELKTVFKTQYNNRLRLIRESALSDEDKVELMHSANHVMLRHHILRLEVRQAELLDESIFYLKIKNTEKSKEIDVIINSLEKEIATIETIKRDLDYMEE